MEIRNPSPGLYNEDLAPARDRLLEWLERRRVPSALAALFCVLLFLIAAWAFVLGVSRVVAAVNRSPSASR